MPSLFPPDQSPFTVAIVGGGIAGLSLAIALHERNIPVKIYEQASRFTEIGAGLGFTPNAIRSMRLCSESLFNAFSRVATGSMNPHQTNIWFDWLNGFDASVDPANLRSQSWMFNVDMPYGERKGNAVHRAAFLEEVLKSLPDDVAEFNKRIDRVDEEADGRLSLHFADGSLRQADVVIGCDGIKSKIRQLILGEDNPQSYPSYTHKYAYRGLIPMEKARHALPEDLITNRYMHLGPGGHIVSFPIAKGKFLNIVAFQTSPEPWQSTGLVVPATKEKATQDFANWHPNVRTIMSLLLDSVDCYGMFDLGSHPPSTYHSGRIAVCGDAAHACGSHLGAGAGLAIEDCLVFAELLAAARDSAGPQRAALEAAVASFTAIRIERTQWAVQATRDVGLLFDWQLPKVGRDPAAMKAALEARSHKIWDLDVPGMIADTRAEFARRLGSMTAS